MGTCKTSFVGTQLLLVATVLLCLGPHPSRSLVLWMALPSSSWDPAPSSLTPRTNSRTNPRIQVSPVQTPQDLIDLATLRYQEWMMEEPEDRRPSKLAFERATAEIQQERMSAQAVAFLARWVDESSPISRPVVGAAELSPIEVEGCLKQKEKLNRPEDCYLYVTDVVTAQGYRRRGIAAELMKVVEQYGVAKGCESMKNTKLLLHVEPTNHAALSFYQAIGYQCICNEPHSDVTSDIDISQLADNAGVGSKQILLFKSIPM